MTHRLSGACLILGFIAVAVTAEEAPATWRPHAHPAFQERRITGFTVPSRDLALAAEVGGRLTVVALDAGQVVPAGGPTARIACRIDDGAAVLACAAAAAAEVEGAAALAQLRAETAVAEREATFQAAELERLQQVGVSGGVAQRDLAAAVFAADAAVLRVAVLQAAVVRGEAGVATAKAALTQAQDRQARHVVVAPSGWTVTDRLREPGAMVQPGEPILLVADTRELAVILYLDEAEVTALSAAGVELTFALHPDRRASARVHHVDVRLDPRSFKRRVELRLAGDTAPTATGGLEVHLDLRLPDPGMLLIPQDYLSVRMEQHYVTDIAGTQRPVTLVRRQNGDVVVAADALPADVVLVRPEDGP